MKKKQWNRLICLYCCVAFLLTIIVACSAKNKTPDTTEPEATGQDSGELQEPGTLPEGLAVADLPLYTVVYPEGGINTELYMKMREYGKLLRERFGTDPQISDDYLAAHLGQTAGEYEILIGETNRSESQEVCANVRRALDYEIAIRGKKLVIAGCNLEGLMTAMQMLIDSMPQAGADCFFEPSMQISYRGGYELENIRLGDSDISEYTLVYEKNSFCQSLANQIAKEVLTRSGWVLPVEEASGADLTKPCILIGNTGNKPEAMTDPGTADHYYLGASGQHFYLYATTTPGLYRAQDEFLKALKAVSTETTELSPMPGMVLFTDTSITSMSFNLLVSNITTERIAHVATMIRKYLPDTLGVQEANEKWMSSLENALSDLYVSVGTGRDKNGAGERSAVFYRKDKFNLIDSGTKWMSDTPDQVSKFEDSLLNRVFTYAILERKTDGARWMHINLHTDHVNNDNVRLKQLQVVTAFMEQYPDLPILVSGDFNNTEGTAPITHMLSSGVDNSAKVALNSNPAYTFSSRVIDFIFVTQGDFRVYDYSVDTFKYGSDGKDPSDHCPVIIRFDLLP